MIWKKPFLRILIRLVRTGTVRAEQKEEKKDFEYELTRFDESLQALVESAKID